MKIAKDPTLKIKEIIKSQIPDSRIVLFGSRAHGDFDSQSDYDIMIIMPHHIDIKQKMKLATHINKLLVDNGIASDIIVQSADEVEKKKKLIGNVVREAMKEGIEI